MFDKTTTRGETGRKKELKIPKTVRTKRRHLLRGKTEGPRGKASLGDFIGRFLKRIVLRSTLRMRFKTMSVPSYPDKSFTRNGQHCSFQELSQ